MSEATTSFPQPQTEEQQKKFSWKCCHYFRTLELHCAFVVSEAASSSNAKFSTTSSSPESLPKSPIRMLKGFRKPSMHYTPTGTCLSSALCGTLRRWLEIHSESERVLHDTKSRSITWQTQFPLVHRAAVSARDKDWARFAF